MLVTEDEAKEKQCPYTFAAPEIRGADGCGLRASGPFGCIGSGCMAWRWQELLADDDFVAAVIKAAEEIGDRSSSHSKAAQHVAKNRAKYGLPDKPYLGFCGMAGAV